MAIIPTLESTTLKRSKERLQMSNPKFSEMALSFAGGDGGNLQSEVWFCGYEWGNLAKTDMAETIEHDFVAQPQPTSWQDEDFDGSWNTNYNRKICWFLEYFYQLDGYNKSYDAFVEEFKILHSNGLGFKLNLLPVRFHDRGSVEWSDNIQTASGFASFADYRVWCVIHRGKFFRDAIRQYQPKLLICTGVGERDNFFRAFTDGGEPERIQLTDFAISVARIDQTQVCVTPFFGGPSGINSHEKMEQLVGSTKALLQRKQL